MQQEFIEAGTLMFAGMVFVFVFLSLLIVFINVFLSKLAVIFPDPVIQKRNSPQNKTNKKASGEISPSVVAAISGAVTQYRKKHKQAK
ncbi:MAG: OadG family protein [Colwellia sp.]